MTGGGKSCCFPKCYTHSGGKKHKGISLFTVPTRKCDAEWTKKLSDVIGAYRTMDAKMKKLIADGKCYVCETHFKPEDIEYTRKHTHFSFYKNLVYKNHQAQISQMLRIT